MERGLEQVVREKIAAKIQEVVHDVHLAIFGVAVAENALGLGIAGVDGQNQHQADQGRDQGGDQEVDNGPESNHSVHLGVQASSSCGR